jgi:hypothetical protein
VMLWDMYGRSMPLPFLPDWTPAEGVTAFRAILVFTLLLLVARIGNWLILWPWYRWERREQDYVLSLGAKDGGSEPAWFWHTCGIGGALFLLLTFAGLVAMIHKEPEVLSALSDRVEDVSGPALVLMAIWVGFAGLLRPPPPLVDDAPVVQAHRETKRKRVLATTMVAFWLVVAVGIIASTEYLNRGYFQPVRDVANRLSLSVPNAKVVSAEWNRGEEKTTYRWMLALPASDAAVLVKECRQPGIVARTERLKALLADAGSQADYGLSVEIANKGCRVAHREYDERDFHEGYYAVVEGRLLELTLERTFRSSPRAQ